MKYIETLREGMRISEIYLCKSKQIAVTKAGKEYGSLVLQDKTGTVDAKIWDLGSPGVGNFEALDYICVDADVTVFMGSNQLNIKRVRKADEGEYVPADYLPVSSKNIEKMYSDLLAVIASLKKSVFEEAGGKLFCKGSCVCQGLSVPQRGQDRAPWLCGRTSGAYAERCEAV